MKSLVGLAGVLSGFLYYNVQFSREENIQLLIKNFGNNILSDNIMHLPVHLLLIRNMADLKKKKFLQLNKLYLW